MAEKQCLMDKFLKRNQLISVQAYNSCYLAKIKGAKIILHVKSPKFRAAKLKGFTVFAHGPADATSIPSTSLIR